MKTPTKLADMDTKHLKCRSFRHHWNPLYTAIETIDRRKAYVTPMECETCGATDVLTFFISVGERHRRGVRYPEGYVVKDLKSWGGRSTLNTNVQLTLFERLVTNGKAKASS